MSLSTRPLVKCVGEAEVYTSIFLLCFFCFFFFFDGFLSHNVVEKMREERKEEEKYEALLQVTETMRTIPYQEENVGFAFKLHTLRGMLVHVWL